MWKPLYGILAAVVLHMWKAEKTDAHNNLLRYFYLCNQADVSYHRAQIRTEERLLNMLPSAREYAQRHPHPFVTEDYMIRQYMYINSVTQIYDIDIRDSRSNQIMLNAFYTVEAYLTAVYYRLCAFFYRNVHIDQQKSDTCFILSSYMEWYFSFMLEEKVEDFCNIKLFFDDKIGGPDIYYGELFFDDETASPNILIAENMCKILAKLNLNFLKFPDESKFIHILQDDDNNVFRPDKLTKYNSNREGYFISIFESYQANEKLENQSQEDYDKAEYNRIYNLLREVYTKNFATLLNYFSQVTTKIPYTSNTKSMISEFELMKIIWNYAPLLLQITHLPTEDRRGIVSFSEDGTMVSDIGNIIYRSNALEILRQISHYVVLQIFPNDSATISQIIEDINSTYVRCVLEHALSTLSIDYCFKTLDEEDI